MRGSAASLAAVVLAAALGVLAVAGPSADGARPSAGAAAKARGRIVFTARFDASAGPYGKGSVPFVAVRNAGGAVVVERRVSSGRTVIPLPARALPPRRVLATVQQGPAGAERPAP